MRGRLIMWGGDGQGYATPYKHYWIVVSRHETAWATPHRKYGRPPLLVVPLNSFENETDTPIGPSDLPILDESEFPFPLGKPTVVRCGHVRALLRRGNERIEGFDGPAVTEELMAAIDTKLVEVFGLEDHVQLRINEALQAHGMKLS